MQLFKAEWIFPIASPPIRGGALAIDGDKIVAVGSADEVTKRYRGDVIHHPGFILPGLVNAHVHLADRPIEPQKSFVKWAIAAIESSRIRRDDRAAVIAKQLKESLQQGVTAVADFDAGPFVSITSAARRIVFAQVMGLGGTDEHIAFDRVMVAVDEATKDLHGIGVHSPYTLSRHLLKIISSRAHTGKIPVQIHAAQSFAEMEFFYDSKGEIAEILFPYLGWKSEPLPHHKTPIGYLAAIGFMEIAPILVSCVHLSKGDLELVTRAKAKVVVVPRSDQRLGNGRASLPEILKCGIPVGLGTGGLATNADLNMWKELAFSFELYGNGGPKGVSASAHLEMATLGGARVLGLDKEIGSLEPGKQADFILGECDMQHTADPARSLVAAIRPPNISAVFVRGQRA